MENGILWSIWNTYSAGFLLLKLPNCFYVSTWGKELLTSQSTSSQALIMVEFPLLLFLDHLISVGIGCFWLICQLDFWLIFFCGNLGLFRILFHPDEGMNLPKPPFVTRLRVRRHWAFCFQIRACLNVIPSVLGVSDQCVFFPPTLLNIPLSSSHIISMVYSDTS